MSKQILIVEDEPDIVETVRYNLEQTGYQALAATDAETALEMVSDGLPDLIVLDLMLPGMNGFDFCKILKQESHTRHVPICVLSGRKEEVDRVLAFELGVDDYVVKPFSPRELMLRIRSILERSQNAVKQPEERLICGVLEVDKVWYRVSVDGQACELTPLEFKLLVTLIERAGRVQTREDLLDAAWGYGHMGNGRMVDAHIRRMRAKLGVAREMVRTVRSVGYCFRP